MLTWLRLFKCSSEPGDIELSNIIQGGVALKQDKLQYFKKRLLEEKKELKNSIGELEKTGLKMSIGDSTGEISAYDQHPGDVGSEVFERSKDFALCQLKRIDMTAVDDALRRIENGTYGDCDICGNQILVDRLEALPHTTICKECKEQKERYQERAPFRPVEEDVLKTVYENGFDEKPNAFDAEDSWQSVARWQEHSPESGAGSYFGPNGFDPGELGHTEGVDSVAYEVGDDGVIYEDFGGTSDETTPHEEIKKGIKHRKIRDD